MNTADIRNKASSTRSSRDTLSEAFLRHDALVKARWKRAILLSCLVNVVAWLAFALSKTPLLHQGANESALQVPMQWTISIGPAISEVKRSSSSQAATTNIHSAVTASFHDGKRASFVASRVQRDDKRATPIETSAQRAQMRNSSRTSSVRRDFAVSSVVPTVVSAKRRVTPHLQQQGAERFQENTSPSRVASNLYPLEHSGHSVLTSTRKTGAVIGSWHKAAPLGTSSSFTRSGSNFSGEGASRAARFPFSGPADNRGERAESGNNADGNGSAIGEALSRGSAGALPSREISHAEDNNPLPQRDEPENRIASPAAVALPEKPRVQETPTKVETRPKPRLEVAPDVPPVRKRVIKEAEVVSQKNVRLPRRLRKEKRKTSVRVEFDIDEKGKASPRVTESSGDKELDEVVLKTARKTRFKPREEDGVATKSTKKMRYDINVDDNEKSSDNDDDDEE